MDENGKKEVMYKGNPPIDHIQTIDNKTICFTSALNEDDQSQLNKSQLTDLGYENTVKYFALNLETKETTELTLNPGKYPYGDWDIPCWVNGYVILTLEPNNCNTLWSKNDQEKYTLISEGWDYYYIYKDKIYFGDKTDSNNCITGLSSCNLDGTEFNTVSVKDLYAMYKFDDITITFQKSDDRLNRAATLVKIKNEKTNDEKKYYIQYGNYGGYDGKYLYCLGDGITRIDISDGSTMKISDLGTCYIYIIDDWIFFENSNGATTLYRVKKDGTSLEKMTD